LHGVDHAAGLVVAVTEADEYLVEHDVAADRDAIRGVELVGEAPGERAASLDPIGDPGAAELP
jgi:hypothetical protein